MALSLRATSLRRAIPAILNTVHPAVGLRQARNVNVINRKFTQTSSKRIETETLVGTKAAVRAANDPSFTPHPTLFEKEFSMEGRVVAVSGGNRGIGLETALALAEAGASVYCFDLPTTPSDIFTASSAYLKRLGPKAGRLEYASLDVTDQDAVWAAIEKVADQEGGRLDACVAAAGIIIGSPCLEYTAADFTKVLNVNVNGVFYFAQACGRIMEKAGKGGSMILVASAGGTNAIRGAPATAYSTSKSAVLQMARSMACELGPKKIRVNTLSPTYILTDMTTPFIDAVPGLRDLWEDQNPLGRLGLPHELRGVATWLASDASTYCTGSDILITGGHTAW